MRPGLNAVVTWVVLPLFGFLNVGVSLAGRIWACCWLLCRSGSCWGWWWASPWAFWRKRAGAQAGVASLPEAASLYMLFGLSLLCGIGFTISLFIVGLAFTDPALVETAKLGIFAGSLIAALSGWLWLRFAGRSRQRAEGG